jgi:hypothetical protein
LKGKINFLLKFFVIAFILFIIWIPVGKAYLLLLALVSKYLLWAMGYHVTLFWNGTPYFLYLGTDIGMKNAHLGNYNIIPLISLILATPNIALNRRLKMLMIGIFLLFCLHTVNFVSHFPRYFDGSEIAGVVMSFIAVGGVAIPFVMWFMLAHKEIFW